MDRLSNNDIRIIITIIMDLEEEPDGEKKDNLYLNSNTVHSVASYVQGCYNLTIFKDLMFLSLQESTLDEFSGLRRDPITLASFLNFQSTAGILTVLPMHTP